MPHRINILLVDDDLDDHDFCRDALDRLKILNSNLVSVYNGREALDYLLKRSSFSGSEDPKPDLIILDLNMPVMDGWDCLKELKKHDGLKGIPVYVLSTSRRNEDHKRCQEMGCLGFFSKPPKVDELQRVLSLMLDSISSKSE